jgi:hypothetical protein
MAIEIEKSNSPMLAKKMMILKKAREKHYQFKQTPRVKPLLIMTKPLSPEKQKIYNIKEDRKNANVILDKINQVSDFATDKNFTISNECIYKYFKYSLK